ncbi:MAG: polysulfide reductase NrfD [Phycisphaerae bacterium]|nr:polysulfide reductase NrfD [Phycisphaerae bacterium]
MMNHAGHMTTSATLLRGDWLPRPSVRGHLRSYVTPFNVVAAAILCIGAPVTVNRFVNGLAATTNLTDDVPWGLWIGFDVLCGVALAAGGFVMAATVHLFGLREYQPLVRPAILTGFLGYFFVVIGLMYDLGRPWRLPFPMVYSPGVTSVMFEVAWCVALYLTVQFLEFCPAIFEWLGLRRWRAWAVWLTTGLTVFGVLLSTLHQSALGGLFLIAPGKLHPLWYSPYLPLLFFASAVAAGIAMVIVESMLSHRVFRSHVEHHDERQMNRLVLGLGRAGAIVLMAYFCMKCLAFAHEHGWHLLRTPYGYWWLVEMLGFILCPCMMYAIAARRGLVWLVRVASVVTVLGIVLNRLNVSIIAYRWDAARRYVPDWQEFVITITIVTTGLIMFRWIVNRMPVLHDDPRYEPVH